MSITYKDIKNNIANGFARNTKEFKEFTASLEASIKNDKLYDQAAIDEVELLTRSLSKSQKRFLLRACKAELKKWK